MLFRSSGDGVPSNPGFDGYGHTAAVTVEYTDALPHGNPMSIHLHLDAGASEPKISVCNPMDDWAEFTLDETAELASEITRLVTAYSRPGCPPWCEDKHRNPADTGNHHATGGLLYAAAPKFSVNGADHANPYIVDLVHDEPYILLADGFHDGVHEAMKLTLREAARVAAAITELVAAGREGRPVVWLTQDSESGQLAAM